MSERDSGRVDGVVTRQHRRDAIVVIPREPTWSSGRRRRDAPRRHYRPQVPIKPELLAEMKARFQSLAAKPIKKVAEARARKRTRAEARLKAAKKRAEAVANDPDMSAGRKLKEVERAMARASKQKRPDKVYVVASKSKSGVRKATSAPKGATKGSRVVSVDARMKKDKRAAKSRAKKQKKC